MRTGLLLLLFLCLVGVVDASHMRGGVMSWKPIAQNSTKVEIFYRLAWRRTYQAMTICTPTVIRDRILISFEHYSIRCYAGLGCPKALRAHQVYCTDISVTEDWSSGAFTFVHDCGIRAKYVVGYSGVAWLGTLVKGGGSWSVRVVIDTRLRQDTGKMNTSPVTAMPAVVVAQLGCDNTLIIPVSDADRDVVRCRWADGAKNECGGVCNAFPGTTLDAATCVLTIPRTLGAGFYAVAITIEDFAVTDRAFATPLSSIPLQFLVVIKLLNQTCGLKAEFLPPTPPNGEKIGVMAGTNLALKIVALLLDHLNVSKPQTDLKTSSPLGLLKSVPYAVSGTDNWAVNVTWTPAASQVGPNIFCFQAVFSAVTTENRCITFIVGDTPPKITSTSPTGTVPIHQSTWKITYDKKILKTTNTRYIKFYEVGNNMYLFKVDASSAAVTIPNGAQAPYELSIKTNYTFKAGSSYYILLDKGIVTGMSGLDTAAVTDPSFWTFNIAALTTAGQPTVTSATKPTAATTKPTAMPTASPDGEEECVCDCKCEPEIKIHRGC